MVKLINTLTQEREMPKKKFSDEKLLQLYNREDEPSLYKIAQELNVSNQALRERAKKLGLKPRPRKPSRVRRQIRTIMAYPKVLKKVDQLSRKLKLSKADVWELAVTELYDRTYSKK
jgi:Zn-dependent peptidase ImmA (M78 family)